MSKPTYTCSRCGRRGTVAFTLDFSEQVGYRERCTSKTACAMRQRHNAAEAERKRLSASGQIDAEDLDKVPPMRMSPDMTQVAIRNTADAELPWATSAGPWLTDRTVSDWIPLTVEADAIFDGFGL